MEVSEWQVIFREGRYSPLTGMEVSEWQVIFEQFLAMGMIVKMKCCFIILACVGLLRAVPLRVNCASSPSCVMLLCLCALSPLCEFFMTDRDFS
jgi:hypothetical protein